MSWRHQMLCECQQKEVCVGLAYITQYMASEDRHQSLKGVVGTWRRWIPIASKGGILQLQYFWTIGRISICHHIHMHTQLPCLGRECVTIQQHQWWITKTNGRAQNSWLVGVTTIPYPRFGVIINIVSKEDTRTMSQFAISHIAFALISQKKIIQSLGKKRGNGCTTNIFILCVDFCARWLSTMTSSFTLQRTPSTRSWNCLILSVLRSGSCL